MSDVTKEVAEVVKEHTAPIAENIANNEKAIKEIYENVQNIVKDQVNKSEVEQMLNEGMKHVSEQNKTLAKQFPRETITLKTFGSAVIRSKSFQDQLKQYGTKSGEHRDGFKVDFKSIAKGLNLYYETNSSDDPNLTNGLTDTNIFDPLGSSASLTPAERYEFAFDQFFSVLDSSFIRGIDLRKTFIFPYINVRRTSRPALKWSEYVPTDPLGFSYVKEGEVKPTQGLSVTSSNIGSLKVAKHMMFTDEIWKDLPRLEDVVFNLLLQEFALKREDAVLNYNSNNDLEDGLFFQATPFDNTTVKQNVQDPNIVDVINGCMVQLSTATNYDFEETCTDVNFVGLNPADAGYLFWMKKDAENRSQAYEMFEMLKTRGIEIVENLGIPEGKILIGDLKKFTFWEYEPYNVRFGLVNDQFIYNQFTIVGEGRHMQGMSVLDRKCIIYDDIATIQQALANGPV
ncbi:hypothetical protein [uncultured Mediterranean phage uvMED]|nr:hypothetical protein [uncultured Mediterranean phage uvMED]